jgi:hypothetical protein
MNYQKENAYLAEFVGLVEHFECCSPSDIAV